MMRPEAPFWVIVLKDLAFVLLVGLSLAIYFRELSDFFIKYKKAIATISICFTLVVLLHSQSKSLAQLTQHYIRNIYMYLLLVPICWVLFKNKKLNLNFILDFFLIANLVVCLIQILWLTETMLDHKRPLGVVGDPIVSSLFNYLLVFRLLFKRLGFWQLLSLLALCFVLDEQASVTALFSVAIALLVVVARSYSSYRLYFIRLVCFAVVFFGVSAIEVRTEAKQDLAGRMISVFYGTVGRALSLQSNGKDKLFDKLKEKRIDAYAGRAIEIDKSSEHYAHSKAQYAISPNFDNEKPNSALVFLFGDFSLLNYFVVDSNILSIMKNHGALVLLIYYVALLKFIWQLTKLKLKDVDEMLFFSLAVLFMGFFFASIYKFPIMLILYIYAGSVLSSSSVKEKAS